MTPYWIKWSEMPWEPVNDRIDRKVAIGSRMMMVLYRFGPDVVWPEERHEAEQAGYIIRGGMELTLPSSGERVRLGPGDGYHIASMVPHSWRSMTEGALLVDIFSPPRTSLVTRKFAPDAGGASAP